MNSQKISRLEDFEGYSPSSSTRPHTISWRLLEIASIIMAVVLIIFYLTIEISMIIH